MSRTRLRFQHVINAPTEHRQQAASAPGRLPGSLPINSPAPDAHAESPKGSALFLGGGEA